MFDLDHAVNDWRGQTAAALPRAPEVLDELEGHLRDDIEEQTRAGIDPEQAFREAVRHMGEADLLREEFAKEPGTLLTLGQRLKNVVLILMGIPELQPAFSMNTSSSSIPAEPRWATYSKAAVFLSPAIILWVFSGMFVLPKVLKLCQVAGVPPFSIIKISMFIGEHCTLILIALAASVFLLEWRWNAWARYRKGTLSVCAFLLNAAILVLITTLVIAAVVAAPQAHFGK
jgi:hypothetical protein